MADVWWLLALLVLSPIVWALAGAPSSADLLTWLAQTAPSLVGSPVVATTPLLAALLLGGVLGAGRAKVATTHVSTVAHEFGHGLAAAALGGQIDRLRLHPDGSGAAHTRLPAGRPVRGLIVSASGYLAPGLLAVASVRAVLAGIGTLWLAYLVAVLALMLVLAIRSWWGALLAVTLGTLGWAVVVVAPPAAATYVVGGLAGVLAGGGLIDAGIQWRGRRIDPGSDAASMARVTGLPVGLFAGGHVLASLALAACTLTLPLWA